jgi:hypothetical protein
MLTLIFTWVELTNCSPVEAMEYPDTVALKPLWNPVPFTVIHVAAVVVNGLGVIELMVGAGAAAFTWKLPLTCCPSGFVITTGAL